MNEQSVLFLVNDGKINSNVSCQFVEGQYNFGQLSYNISPAFNVGLSKWLAAKRTATIRFLKRFLYFRRWQFEDHPAIWMVTRDSDCLEMAKG
jgi:hypothetical protein